MYTVRYNGGYCANLPLLNPALILTISLVKNYKIILYKQIDSRWHYVRLTTRDTELITETGLCGVLPDIHTNSM